MRIGLISGEYPPMRGGVGDYSQALAEALRSAGHAVAILTDRRAAEPDGAAAASLNAAIRRWHWPSLLTMRRWAKRERLDIINLQFETAAYGMSAAIHALPWVLGVPLVTTFHDLRAPYLFPKAGRLRDQALWWLVRGSAGVIVTDAADGDRLRDQVPGRAVRVIPIGSNIPTTPPPGFNRQQWRHDHAVNDAALLIGYFGFMNASKGIEALVDGLAQAVSHGLDGQLVLIGGGVTESDPGAAAYTTAIRSRLAGAGLTARTHWTGFVAPDQVSGWLLACDVVALPFSDGLSLRRGSFLAALAHGCTILTTRPSAPIDGLDSAAAWVTAGDVAGIADQLTALAADPERRAALGIAAAQFAERFTWPTIAAQTVAFYAECLAAR